jgi:Secretion system C-terminal sorting domain
MKKIYLLYILLLTILTQNSYSQGLIINEVNQGPAGAQEYVELLVVGNTAQPTGNISLAGWVIDDNNGEFEGFTTTGVAPGHIRIAAGNLTNVPIGSIIIIYNSADIAAGFPANDPTDANNDKVYIIPSNSTILEVCTTNPTSSSSLYTGCASYTAGSATAWNTDAMRNAGDAIQIRRPDFSFYDGFSFGDVTAPFPVFPISGTSSFNVNTVGGNAALQCGNYFAPANYTATTAGGGTPGAANSAANSDLINSIRNGSFNYSLLTNLGISCSGILPISFKNFTAKNNNSAVTLNWQAVSTDNSSYFEVEKSSDGNNYTALKTVNAITGENIYSFVDNSANKGNVFYRVKMTDADGSSKYSNIIRIQAAGKTFSLNNIYPTVVSSALNLQISSDKKAIVLLEITDVTGRLLKKQKLALNDGTVTYPVDVSSLSAGSYFLSIAAGEEILTGRFAKQ